MITYQEETYRSILNYKTFPKLITESWVEMEVFNNTFKIKIQLEMYKTLEHLGVLKIYSVIDSKILIGFFIAIIAPHSHYRDVIAAETDVFFLSKEYRKGLVGFKFLKYVIKELKKNVNLIFFTENVNLNLSSIMKRLHFKLVDRVYALGV